jgi:tetratricopeptide (TPR) repeat protein
MTTVLNNSTDTKQVLAVGDLALMIKDLGSADAAYKKAAMLPDGADRAKRGMDLVAKARDLARQDLTLADDLAKRKQLASAIDKYHAAIYGNPVVPDAHRGLAETLERMSPPTSKELRESITQYKAFIALTPMMPPKELEKMNKHISKLDEKAYKLEQKEQQQHQGR